MTSEPVPISSSTPSPTPGARLGARIGGASAGAPLKVNEDFYGVAAPQDGRERGIVLAVADGISAGGDARAAAEMTVRSMLADFYATPAAWSTARTLDRLLESANDWLASENLRRPALSGIVAALSVLVLRADRYHVAHVGDTRIYRLRGRLLEQITHDHTWPRRDMRHVLRRAVGLDSYLVADFSEGELQPGDVFLLVSDGVWDVLDEGALREALVEQDDPERTAVALVSQALARQAVYMGRNDATAAIARIETLG
ncbi:MAG TPA: PP2C family serine/threonine-protein phosphatase [Burkholderiales bacterium]|nr:PP2C family serine/threonine-protein phosphatase [Burkholderiales bacterium]